jgi:hypothetical protein
MTNYVIRQGFKLLVLYGWPARALQQHDKCTLERDQPIQRLMPGGETVTTDENGDDAFYLFSLNFKPMVFNCEESAQDIIDRFKLPDARAEAWRGEV